MINKELQLHFENELRLIVNNDSSKTTKLIFKKDKTEEQKAKVLEILTRNGFKTTNGKEFSNENREVVTTNTSIRIRG